MAAGPEKENNRDSAGGEGRADVAATEQPVEAGSTGSAESVQAAGTVAPAAAGLAAARGKRDEDEKEERKVE